VKHLAAFLTLLGLWTFFVCFLASRGMGDTTLARLLRWIGYAGYVTAVIALSILFGLVGMLMI